MNSPDYKDLDILLANAWQGNFKPVVKVILIYHAQTPYMLFLRRAPLNSFAGINEPPGGKVEKGETLLQAALREVHEETGITLANHPKFLAQIHFDGIEKYAHIREFVFCARVNTQEIKLQAEEHDAYQWISLDALDTIPMQAYVKKMVAEHYTTLISS